MIADDRLSVSADILNGWKEIAVYLDRSVRSVQRWETELELPIHRVRTADGQTVYAVREELDAWRRARDLPPQTDDAAPDTRYHAVASPVDDGLRRRLIGFAGLFALGTFAIGVVTGIWATTRFAAPRGAVESLVFAGQRLEARDGLGRVAWTHDFRHLASAYEPVDADTMRKPFTEMTLNGEAIFIVPVRAAPAGEKPTTSDAVYAFTREGRVRLVVSPTTVLFCGRERYEGPWFVSALAPSRATSNRVWVAFRHHTWWPSFVLEIDGHGAQTVRYVQSGWITALTAWMRASREYLVAGGVMNEQARASVTLIDLDGATARSPFTDPQFACVGGGSGAPAQVSLLPRLDVTEAKQNAYALVQYASVAGSQLKISLDERAGSAIALIGPDLTFSSFVLSDNYWALHRTLEQQNRINHTAEQCPERTRSYAIEQWTAATGWYSQVLSHASSVPVSQ